MKKFILPALAFILLPYCTPVVKEYKDLKQKNYKKYFASGQQAVYSGDSLRNILFPVGGIGTGDLLLGGRGEINELEIFGSPAIDGEKPNMTFFALWFKEGEEFNSVEEVAYEPIVKILERRLHDDFPSPWGVSRNQLSGLPRFDEVEFSGLYPFAELHFTDRDIPIKVELEVFNPLIPHDLENSGLPAAIFHWNLTNTLDKPVEVSTMMCMSHPFKSPGGKGPTAKGTVTEAIAVGDFTGINFSSAERDRDSEHYGNFSIVSLPDLKLQTHGYRGRWWDNAHRLWDDFRLDGELEEISDRAVNPGDTEDVAACWVKKLLEPGETLTVPFILTWYLPVRIAEENMAFGNTSAKNLPIKNYYATRFDGSAEVAEYIIDNRQYLNGMTREYTETLQNSSYPDYVIDAVSANVAGLKTNLLMMDDQGRVHGFEGLGNNAGCCAGNCTHVWNYAQTMAFLFPEMERRVREVSFLHDTHENGYQCFRTTFPPGDYWFKATAADGQMGNILRLYREWKLSGDNQWLTRLWPKAKAAMEFAWKGTASIEPGYQWQKNALIPWDPYKEGVMRGKQHNTYDIDLYGPNMMTGSLYLGALKATAEMALAMNEPDKASEYLDLYERGKQWYERELWNGEYFIQKTEVVEGIEIPQHLSSPPDDQGLVLPKYQYGEGCLSDQLLGQFLAHVSGLGYILDRDKVDQAMKSIYRYNFKPSLADFENVQRVYGLNDEGGLIACTWPHGQRPAFPFVYADEIWTGIEYQVAASLIWSGYVDDGLEIVKAVRKRYKGFNRNPWAEIESGRFYARSMASWAILQALSGFRYDGVSGEMEFNPRVNQDDFMTFWSSGKAWGSFHINGEELDLHVSHGSLKINELRLPSQYGYISVEQSAPCMAVVSNDERGIVLTFETECELAEQQSLVIKFGK